ncbi:MAG: methyl-accepting chemotaxis protein [Kiloniellales bacterium]
MAIVLRDPPPPEEEGAGTSAEAPAEAALRLGAALAGRDAELAALRALVESSALIVQHLVQLQQHAHGAGEVQEAFMQQIEVRSAELRRGIEATRAQVESSTETAGTLKQEADSEIVATTERISSDLKGIAEELDQKAQGAARVLQTIEDIGKSIRLLALNAKIEASRAGEHGRGFAVVAQEVGALAHSTMQETKTAVELIDLSGVKDALNQTVGRTSESLTRLTGGFEESLERLKGLFVEMSGRLSEIDEHNQVVGEILACSRNAAARSRQKVSWSVQDLTELGQLMSAPGDAAVACLEQLMARNDIEGDPAFDRLAAIRARGCVRIAIEPAFIGLSFSLKPGEPLRGLDADYARAFAKWLGVDCEFITQPWDVITELLFAGRAPGEPKADLVWSALPPNQSYRGVAYSETYTCLPFVLCRRAGDESVKGIADLNGKVLGIINDPGAFAVLEGAGLRWKGNEGVPGGKVTLANLIAYTDQSRIHDCLADGVVDAFAVDRPIYYWACNDPASPWHGRIEILPANLSEVPYYYTAAVAAEPANYALLAAVNAFLRWYKGQPERDALERRWQGEALVHGISYRDEPGDLMGEPELEQLYEAHCRSHGLEPRQP